MDNKLLISSGVAAFYITDICNLTCSECGSFNNHNIKGHSEWNKLSSIFQQYSTEVNFKRIEVLGGEPLLHPGLKEWCQGLRELWPDTEIRIVTNGTRIATTRGLYDLMLTYNIIMEVSLHSYNEESILTSVTQMLQGPVTTRLKLHEAPVSKLLTDENDVQVIISKHSKFIKQSNFTNNQFYKSNPVKAHNACSATGCHEMRDGKFYKCPLVPAILNVNRQLDLNLDSEAIELLEQYQPMEASWSYERKQEFINNLTQPIPQCRICPEHKIFTAYTVQNKKDI
jgi:organic radical activating enzyme